VNRYKDWIEQAERDLGKVKLDIRYRYYDWASFTSQQSAEKAAKALCMKLGFDAWGHSITNTLKLLKDTVDVPDEIIEQAQLLDTFYILARYPNGFSIGKPADYYNEKIAEEALHACEKVFGFCKTNINR
jgi:HEPN domain-containing protein